MTRLHSLAPLLLATLSLTAHAEELTISPDARPTYRFCGDVPGIPLAAADVNGDGKADVIVGGNSLSVFFGNGDGSLQPCKAVDAAAARVIAAADFDHDGTVDLLAASASSPQLRFLKGTGGGEFAPAVVLTLPDANFGALTTGDVNGDGIPDAVAVSWHYSGGRIAPSANVYFGSPGGLTLAGSWPLNSVSDNANWLKTIALWKQPDGKLQLLVAGYYVIDTYSWNSGGGFSPSTTYPINAQAFADLDGDGYLDIVRPDIAFGSANGWSAFVHPANLRSLAVAADMNGDGHPDLVSMDGVAIAIALNQGGRTFVRSPKYFYIHGGDNWIAADLDHDGFAEIVTTANGPESSSSLTVIRGSANGELDAPLLYFPSDSTDVNVLAVFKGDFDRDGRLDFGVVWNSLFANDTPAVTLFMNRGGGFERLPPLQPAIHLGSSHDPRSVATATGDFDGDGNLDVAIYSIDTASIFFGKGDGRFTEVGFPDLPFFSSETADVFNEGRSDLLTWSGVILGITPDRKLLPPVQWPPLSGNIFALGDINGDRLLDRLDTDKTLINNGRGLVRSMPPPTPPLSMGWALGDADGDGKLDLFVPGVNWWSLSVRHGRGDGTFEFPTYSGHPLETSLGSRSVFDWDGDGLADVVDQHSILLNRGDNQFERMGQLPDEVKIVESGDFDGDGHRDAIGLLRSSLALLLSHPATRGNQASSITVEIGGPQTLAVRLRAHVTSAAGIPSGVVRFREGAQIVGSAAIGTWAAVPLRAGKHTITAEYTGDAQFGPASATVSLSIPRASIDVIASLDGNVTSLPLTASAKLGNGGELFEPTGTVTFHDGQQTLAFGPASMAMSAPATLAPTAVHPIYASYSGDENYLPSNSQLYNYSFTDVPVSPSHSTLTVLRGSGIDNVEVYLAGPDGASLAIDPTRPPLVSVTTSHGDSGFAHYRGNGRYTIELGLARIGVELLTVTARVNSTVIGTVILGPPQPRRRAAGK